MTEATHRTDAGTGQTGYTVGMQRHQFSDLISIAT